MALPVLAVATAVKILGPAAAKAAKLAYKAYKQRTKNPVSEKKFLSNQANKVLKKEKQGKQYDKEFEKFFMDGAKPKKRSMLYQGKGGKNKFTESM